MELRPRDRVVQLKILYYGPAIGGKTTNLQTLHAAAQSRHRGELIMVNSQQERTILFDLLPLRGLGFHGFDIRFQLVAAPGQSPYTATRRLVTRGTDAVVFVANSAADRLQENVASLQEMNGNLVTNGLDPATLPIVFQYNKRDLPEILPVEELSAALNRRQAPSVEAVAVRGEGVLETLAAILGKTMEYLSGRYRSLALEPGETAQAWTWGAIQQVFARTTLAGMGLRPPDAREPLDYRRVQVSVPRAARGAAGPAKDEALVDSYVQASMALGQALEQMREERDEARRRVEEMELMLRAIEALGDGQPPGETLQAAIEQLVAGADCRRGSLIAPGADRRLRMVAAVGMEKDPFLASPDAFEVFRQHFIPLKQPVLLNLAEQPDVAAVLARLKPPVTAAVVAPVRSGFGLHALVLFYFAPIDPLPSPVVLDHVGRMARALAPWFVVQRSQSLEASAQAARHALPEIERVARLASELLRAASRQPEQARAHLERAARDLEGVATLAAALGAAEHDRPRAAPPPDKSGH